MLQEPLGAKRKRALTAAEISPRMPRTPPLLLRTMRRSSEQPPMRASSGSLSGSFSNSSANSGAVAAVHSERRRRPRRLQRIEEQDEEQQWHPLARRTSSRRALPGSGNEATTTTRLDAPIQIQHQSEQLTLSSSIVHPQQRQQHQQPLGSIPMAMTTLALVSQPPQQLVVGADSRRALLAQASRMKLLLLDRLRCVALRRTRRCELLDEIVRLKRVMQELQDQVDATTRGLRAMDQLVQQMQRLSSVPPGSSGRAMAPATPPVADGGSSVELLHLHEAQGHDDAAIAASVLPFS